MRARILSLVAVSMSLFAVACGADTAEPTGGRFDDEGDGQEQTDAPEQTSTPATSKQTPAETPTGSEQGSQPTPAAPGDPTPPATPTNPTPTRSCGTAKDLGTISGDVGADQVVATGNCSDWVKVRVTENNSYPVIDSLEVTATLVSPTPEDYDLYAYVNEAADAVECSAVTAKSELAANRSDTFKFEWGEKYYPNASDDSRTVTFEVRKKGGGCGVGQWSLVVQGNR